MSKLFLNHQRKSMTFFALIKNLLLQNILARKWIINKIYIKVESNVPMIKISCKKNTHRVPLWNTTEHFWRDFSSHSMSVTLTGTWLWKGTGKAIRNYFVNLAIVVPLQCINGVSQIPGWSVQVVFFFLKSECWCQISSDESCPSSFTMVLSTSPWILYKY